MARPSTSLISREAAIRTTLELIDEEGYENFSLAKLAQRMGVRSPSLYYYFSGRSEILEEAARELLMEVRVPPDYPVEEWREWFIDLCRDTYQLIMRHPRAAGLVFTYFPNTVVLPSHERSAKLMIAAGVASEDLWVVIKGMEKLIFGLAYGDAQDLVAERPSVPRGIERTHYPALAGAVDASPGKGIDLMERAVRLLLAGVGMPDKPTRRRQK
jgi:TetR/AcrR family tetracycline transcriptional repressor